jgi:lipoate-protein ligase A
MAFVAFLKLLGYKKRRNIGICSPWYDLSIEGRKPCLPGASQRRRACEG